MSPNSTGSLWHVPESVLARRLDGETLVVNLENGAVYHCDAGAQAFFEFFREGGRLEDYFPEATAESTAWLEFVRREGLLVARSTGSVPTRVFSTARSIPSFLRQSEKLNLNAVGLNPDTRTGPPV